MESHTDNVLRFPAECKDPHALHPSATILETCTLDADRDVMVGGWHEVVVGGDSPIARAFRPMAEICEVHVRHDTGTIAVYRRPTR